MACEVGKKACVVGGSGYVGPLLVKLLLQKGYAVNTTVRDPDDQVKISPLIDLQQLGNLNIFRADLAAEQSLRAPIQGCEFVFQVATPVNFASRDPETDMIKPAIKGVINVIKACAESRSVKRLVLTSSIAAVTINTIQGTGLVMTEENWTDADFLTSTKPPIWGYPVSKTLEEKKAWELAKEHNIDLVTVIPSLITGLCLTPNVPSCVGLAACLLTGNEYLLNVLKRRQMLYGSISISHIEDVCRAHIFVAETESVSGRYICCDVNTSVPDLAEFLKQRYPEYKVPTNFGELPCKTKLEISSEKLIKQGFSFKYGIQEIYDDTVEYLKEVGALKN